VDILAKTLGEGYQVLLNDGTGRFAAGWDLENSQVMRGDIALADFDGDGDLDALVANGSSSEGRYPTRLLWNDGGGQFADSGQELNETSAAKFDVGDLDRDGNLDVFVSNADRPNEVWLNDGNGQFTDSGLRLEGSGRSITTRPSLGDLDGDGDLDVVVAGFRGKVEVWINGTPLPPRDGGGVIAFYSERTGNGDIYVMESDGSNPKRVTTHGALDHWPSWSPDGTQIAFVSTQTGNADIYVINVDGTNRKRLTTSAASDWEPAWSPNGDRIAFSSLRDGDADIYVMNADGSAPIPLTNNDANDAYPSWSPDGTKIAFCTDRDGVWEIYVLDVDGTDQIRLTHNQTNDWVPVWSLDGSKIVFTSERDGNFEIYIMNADGSSQTRMTNHAARDMEASWSPDGSQVLFNSNRSGNHEIYVMEISENLEPGEIIRLTEDEAEDDHAVWSPTQ
jgi:dipeptidyl aminopeptidase/acylaminoacyl peptidase